MSSYLSAGVFKLRQAREYVTPTRKETAFLTKGVLTPEEFVKAGDELVFKCPTWAWEKGDISKVKNYLPSDKQYLVTRNVPCMSRASGLEESVSLQLEDTLRLGDDDVGGDESDDWCISHTAPLQQGGSSSSPIQDVADVSDAQQDVAGENPTVKAKVNPVVLHTTTVEDEYADLDEFEDQNVTVDEAVVTGKSHSVSSIHRTTDGSNIIKVRTYDLSITYDKYYQTPRVWMMGFSEDSSQPLTGPQMMEDVMGDYAMRTVTLDPHPHVAGIHASIHPCRHAAVMKTIVKNLSKATEPSVESYLFIFLKFVSSIIPTITYDYTMEVHASTQKSDK